MALANKINLQQSPQLHEKLLFGILIVGIFIIFMRYFYTPHSEQNKQDKGALDKLRPNYEAFLQIEKAPVQQTTTPVINKNPLADPFQQKSAERFSDPPKYKELVLTELNSALVGRELLRGAELISINMKEEQIKTDFSIYPFEINIGGGYNAIIDYLQKTLTLPMLVAYDQLELLNNPNVPGKLSLKVGGTLYVPVPGQKDANIKPEVKK